MHARTIVLLGAMLAFGGCAIHHVTPYVPDASLAPATEAGADTAADCLEASTAAEAAICASPALSAADITLRRALQRDLRAADLFARDTLLASQRVWLLALPAQCRLPDFPGKTAPDGVACLNAALAERTGALQAWRAPPQRAGGPNAIAQYVAFHDAAGAAAQPDPGLCATIAQRANAALKRGGTVDPSAMGGDEIAGTHAGADAGAGAAISVDQYDANVYALFQRRARSVSLGSAVAITSSSLTQMLEARSTANQGGRFSAFASQTGDYGAIDVFSLDGRRLVLASDPWGSTTPAAPGEAAHAGVWDISSGAPVPACLFDIYTRPAEPGAFADLPSFAAWREVLAQVRDSAVLPLGNGVRRDQARLDADTVFSLLHMPLVAVQQAEAGGWTLWLRRRHDAVLDALFAWSARDPANKPVFDRIFADLRPAASDLVRAYQSTQALSASEATEAAGLTIMELLYAATRTIAPGLGGDLAAPGDAAGSKPRYPILASPQS